jgi:peptidylprolyl isomerase
MKLTVENGNAVSVHYVGTLSDGSVFDDSRARGESIEVTVGSGQLIPKFEEALVGMEAGQKKSIVIPAEEAYGPTNPDAFTTVSTENFPAGFEFEVGGVVQGQSESGMPVVARITSLENDDVTLDMNHPLAGKNLSFDIEVLSIDADAEVDSTEVDSTDENNNVLSS